MKTFTKVSLIICGVFLVLGVVLVSIGSAMGLPDQFLKKAAREDLFNVWEDQEITAGERGSVSEKPAAEAGQISEIPAVDDYEYSKTITDNVRELEIDIAYGAVRIVTHAGEDIYVLAENTGKYFKCWVEEQELHLEDKRKSTLENLDLAVYIPETKLQELSVDLGAGYLEAGTLQVGECSLDVGAGECVIERLEVSGEAELSVGAGRIQVDAFVGNHLEGNCGAGELEVGLQGSFANYNYEIDAAIGEILLGEQSYGGLANDKSINNGAVGRIELDCAVGSIKIHFTDN
ncbi:MAG: hypothetical protein IJ036_03275 [Lachnospiraceae bacterium]|nr:hypothetical protein [Lachnospiraceae bacterium]